MAYNLDEINERCRTDAAGFIAECDAVYADRLEKAVMDTVNSGIMTQDLALLYEGEAQTVTSRMFLYAVASKLPAAE